MRLSPRALPPCFWRMVARSASVHLLFRMGGMPCPGPPTPRMPAIPHPIPSETPRSIVSLESVNSMVGAEMGAVKSATRAAADWFEGAEGLPLVALGSVGLIGCISAGLPSVVAKISGGMGFGMAMTMIQKRRAIPAWTRMVVRAAPNFSLASPAREGRGIWPPSTTMMTGAWWTSSNCVPNGIPWDWLRVRLARGMVALGETSETAPVSSGWLLSMLVGVKLRLVSGDSRAQLSVGSLFPERPLTSVLAGFGALSWGASRNDYRDLILELRCCRMCNREVRGV